MTYDEIKKSFDEASELFRLAKDIARIAIDKIARNNLKNLGLTHWALDDLKRELTRWDMHKHRWK